MSPQLSGYTVAHLQTALLIAELIAPESGLCDVLRVEIDKRTAPAQEAVRVLPTPCPSPGCQGFLTAWPQSSREAGIPIVGCLLCRYSRAKDR